MLYKLDRGVDHVLIDEAQDTSPRQWDIVAHIISEFTSGAGARDGVVRTVFAVGDEKQSIFSFQGAAPREFRTCAAVPCGGSYEGAGLKFDPVSFTYSFRSGPAILHAVDQVFAIRTFFAASMPSISAIRSIMRWPTEGAADRSLGTRGSRRPAGHR